MGLQATALNRPLPTAGEMWVGVVDGTPITIDVYDFLGITKASTPGDYTCRATFKLREASTEQLGVIGFPTEAVAVAYTPALTAVNGGSPDGRCHEVSQDDNYVITKSRRFLRLVASGSCTLEIHFEAGKPGV
jgi:hypothetical protein